jgi:hypothetical protein
MIPTTMLIETANHRMPQRSTTTAANARSTPTPAPQASTTRRRAHASRIATRMSGDPRCVIAKANVALRKKHAMVIPTMRRIAATSAGPVKILKSLSFNTWNLMSNNATQIHIAGSTCTSVRRQFDTTIFSPSNSMTNAPATRASGASNRCR